LTAFLCLEILLTERWVIMKEYEKIFKEYLYKRGLKLTLPRKIIIDYIFKTHDHFDADTIYTQIRSRHKNVSRATVYRTIPLLIDAGLIRQSFRHNGKDYYEHIYGHDNHLHFFCNNCHSVIEINSDKFEPVMEQLSKKINFQIKEYKIEILGLCKKCRSNKSDRKESNE